MSVCPILPWPHPVLAQPSGVVGSFDQHIAKLCRDLHDTAEAAKAPSLAAIQIGARARIVYIGSRVAGEDLILVNPVVEERGLLLQHFKESCASAPGIVIDMQRASSIRVAAHNARGDEFTVRATGLLAQALQHELAHLEGVTIIDASKKSKRWFYRDRLKKYGGAEGCLLDYRNMSATG